MASKIYPVIMAGGSGTRFWPVSRKAKPKQFLALGSSEESLIQSTARRIAPLISGGNGELMVVTNADMKKLVEEHLPDAVVVEEPCARNTAACIALAAIEVLRRDPEGVMIILPADHSVSDEQTLRDNLSAAISLAEETGGLVTVGIKPESPNTAYGYIKKGEQTGTIASACKVDRFYEKPNIERAIEYCEAGTFYWNSGMFIWKASKIMEAFTRHMPKLSKTIGEISAKLGQPGYQAFLEQEFAKLESISIDFGVLEHADNCYMIAAKDFGWNDVGSWDAWAQHYKPDTQGNVNLGECVQVQSSDCIVYSKDGKRLISLLGVSNLVVVDTDDALMICDRSKVQDVKLIVDLLKKENRADLL